MPYEGLTCNALEWTGEILFDNNVGVLEALDHARGWAKENGISPDARRHTEAESLKRFLAGDAAFLRSGPSAYAKLKQAGIDFGFAPLPRGNANENFGVVGGWQLAATNKSRNPLSAIEFIRYLSGPEVQKWRDSEGAYQPTRKVPEPLPLWDSDRIKAIQPIIRPSSRLGVATTMYRNAFIWVDAALNRNSKDEINQDIVNMKTCIERESKGIEREYKEPLKGEG